MPEQKKTRRVPRFVMDWVWSGRERAADQQSVVVPVVRGVITMMPFPSPCEIERPSL